MVIPASMNIQTEPSMLWVITPKNGGHATGWEKCCERGRTGRKIMGLIKKNTCVNGTFKQYLNVQRPSCSGCARHSNGPKWSREIEIILTKRGRKT